MNPTLNSPKYADPKSLAFQMYKKQQDRKQRINPYVPQLEQRYFRRNEGTTDYATIPEVTLAGDFVIEFDFLSAAVSVNQNIINFGDFLIRIQADTQINVWGSVDFSPAVFVVPELGAQIHNIRIFGNTNSTSITLYLDGVLIGTADGGSAPVFSGSWLLFRWVNTHFKGILANLKIYDNGTLVRDYPLNDNSDILRNRAASLGQETASLQGSYTKAGGALSLSGDVATIVDPSTWGYVYKDFAVEEGATYLVVMEADGDLDAFDLQIWDKNVNMFTTLTNSTFQGGVAVAAETAIGSTFRVGLQRSSGGIGMAATLISMTLKKADGYGTIINGNADDWGLFDKQANGDWLGEELGRYPAIIAEWSKVNVTVSGNTLKRTSTGVNYAGVSVSGLTYGEYVHTHEWIIDPKTSLFFAMRFQDDYPNRHELIVNTLDGSHTLEVKEEPVSEIISASTELRGGLLYVRAQYASPVKVTSHVSPRGSYGYIDSVDTSSTAEVGIINSSLGIQEVLKNA